MRFHQKDDFAKFKDNINVITQSFLCCGCGFCEPLCPKACIQLSFDPDSGQYKPLVDHSQCNECGLCLAICPGHDVNQSPPLPQTAEGINHHPQIGNHIGSYVGYSTNKQLHARAASGGLASAILIHLLRTNACDGAIVVKSSPSAPFTPFPFVATNETEILEAQQSRYCPVPLGKFLDLVKSKSGKYALVGLPCQLQALHKATCKIPSLKSQIAFTIGLLCSRTPSLLATMYLLEKRNINPAEVLRIQYRAGSEHMGYLDISLKGNRTIKVPHLHPDYWGHVFSKFFIPLRCYLCRDKVASYADISLGDDWSNSLVHDHGVSSAIVRSSRANGILSQMKTENRILLKPVSVDTLVDSQELKRKQNGLPRKFLWKLFDKNAPQIKKASNETVLLKDVLREIPNFVRMQLSRKKKKRRFFNRIVRLSLLIDNVSHYCIRTAAYATKALLLFVELLTSFLPSKADLVAKKTPFKVVMIGGYGTQDIGDEAMPHCDILNLRKIFGKSLDIVMLSVDPDYTATYHGEKSIEDITKISPHDSSSAVGRIENSIAYAYMIIFLIGTILYKNGIYIRLWPSAFRAIREIDSADLLFNVGGGNLNSIIPQELYKKSSTYLAASLLKTPVVVSGQTIGPLDSNLDRHFAKTALNKVDIITFRDKGISRTRCIEAGINKPILVDAADDAMTLPYLNRDDAQALLSSDPGLSKKWIHADSDLLISMNLKGSLKIFKSKGTLSDLSCLTYKMAAIADYLIAHYNARILFIPTDFNPFVDDRDLHRIILSSMQRRDKAAALENEYNDIALKGMINLSDLSIGSRYHFCVFAASLNRPFLGIGSGIYQLTKLQGLADLCQLPECFFKKDLEIARLDDVYHYIDYLMQNRNEISDKLRMVVPSLVKSSLTAVYYSKKVLAGATYK